MFKFNVKYFLLTILLFLIEVAIALYVHDKIIRPYIGDVLVVILIYCFVKSFINSPVFKTALSVLIFSYVIEILQYFEYVKLLGLENSKLANVVMGNYFAGIDLLAYTAGAVLILFFEYKALYRISR